MVEKTTMTAPDVTFIRVARESMKLLELSESDETIITALLEENPMRGSRLLPECESLRKFPYPEEDPQVDVLYCFFPNSDVQLNGSDVVIVLAVAVPNSVYGGGLDADAIVRIVETIAELTRVVFSG
jgi:hypothetical protein